jgi:peptidoglycan hydrolase-like protein with peptidoglycan-binding domain
VADLDLTEKLGGQPKWVWIIGGVAVASGFLYYRSRKQGTATTGVSYDSSLQDGSSGGQGLATDSPMGTPAGTGITSPTPVQSVPKPYSETSAASKPVLKLGATGELVSSLQSELAASGFNVPVTGIFDRRTSIAVRNYQTSRGLSKDGIVGAKTWAALTLGTRPVDTHNEKVTVAKVKTTATKTGRSTSKPNRKVTNNNSQKYTVAT